jgi:hypothetical protein
VISRGQKGPPGRIGRTAAGQGFNLILLDTRRLEVHTRNSLTQKRQAATPLDERARVVLVLEDADYILGSLYPFNLA